MLILQAKVWPSRQGFFTPGMIFSSRFFGLPVIMDQFGQTLMVVEVTEPGVFFTSDSSGLQGGFAGLLVLTGFWHANVMLRTTFYNN